MTCCELSIDERIQESTQAALARLRGAAADAWRPVQLLPTPEWVASKLRLSPEVEAGAGNYDLRSRPWWRDVLACYDDPEVREVDVIAATQLGKTLAVIAAILACASRAPAPGMVVLPDKDAAIEFRDRLYLDASASPDLRRFVPPSYLWNTRYIDLGPMRVYLAWSGSRQRLRGRPCCYTWLSEVDVYQSGDKTAGDPVKAADQRVKAFYRYLQWRESSPSEDPSRIASLEAACSDRRRWQVQCPHCGAWQELRFFPTDGRGGILGLKDEHGEWLSPEQAREQAHYVCAAGCRIENEEKQDMLLGGRWISEGQWIDKRGRTCGPAPTSRRKVGFHLWSIFADTITFGDLAAAYLEARADGKVPEFYGNWLGMAFKQRTRVPTWEQLGRRAAGKHSRGEVPAEVWFLTAGGDVQDDRVFYTVRGWAPHCTSWLVDWGEFARATGDERRLVKSDLEQLTELLERRYACLGTNPLGRRDLRVRMLCLDSNHRTLDVHEWMRSLPESWRTGDAARIRAVRGDHQVDPELRWRMNVVDRSVRDGTVYKGGLEQWGLYVYPFYHDLIERLSGEADGPGAWWLTSDVLTQGKTYLRQLTNFQRVEVERGGRRRKVWRPKNRALGVDYWDCEIYDLVAAHMVVGDLGWAPEAFAAWLRKSAPRKKRKSSERLDDR